MSWKGGGEVGVVPTFNAEILNSLCPVGVGGTWTHVPTFDAESKSSEIQNSLCPARWRGGVRTLDAESKTA